MITRRRAIKLAETFLNQQGRKFGNLLGAREATLGGRAFWLVSYEDSDLDPEIDFGFDNIALKVDGISAQVSLVERL